MTNEQKLRYAQKTGGMVGRMLTSISGDLVTLDKTFWNGYSYTFIFNISERVGTLYYKQIFTLSVLTTITSGIVKNAEDNQKLPAVFHMINKLESMTK